MKLGWVGARGNAGEKEEGRRQGKRGMGVEPGVEVVGGYMS